jgi:FkbM family methyltransferase
MRLRFAQWSRERVYRTVLAHLQSPAEQQKVAHDLIRGGDYPLTTTESFEFMCHVLGWRRRSKSQLWQDIWVLHRAGFKRSGFFVDVGASDGIQWSNSYLLEKSFDWRGILVEPNPLHRDTLPANRSSRVHLGCVGATTGEDVAFWCARDAELSGIARYAGQDDHTAARGDHTVVQMKTISLNDVLRECAAPEAIDYVSLDTEGSELEILSTFDFARFRVKLWTIEHNHTANEARIDSLMHARGYVRELPAWSQFDAWYVLKD